MVQKCRCRHISIKVQMCRHADVQMCRCVEAGAGAKVQRCKGAKVQRCRGAEEGTGAGEMQIAEVHKCKSAEVPS